MASSQPAVFIIDDDPAVRDALSDLMDGAGLPARTFVSAQAFLTACKPDWRGCLVLDVGLPDMSGLDLQAELTHRRINLPVILLTGYADVATTLHAFRAGAIDVIEKPFDAHMLLQRVREALALPVNHHGQTTDNLAQLTLASLGEAVLTTNTRGAVEYLNPVAEYLTGWSRQDASGMPLLDVFHVVDELTREPVALAHYLNGHEGVANAGGNNGRRMLISRGGQEYAIEESISPIRDPMGRVLGTVVIFRDATQARATADQLAYQASHDSLTGLVNRREFERRLERAIAGAHERHGEHVLLFLDLDRFKQINDSAGHAAGDQLLCRISALLTENLRQRDTLARLGGDEFAILLENCPLQRGEQIAHELCQAVANFQLVWQKQALTISVSIGVAPITAASESANKVLQLADAACYKAKNRGRNQVIVHRESGGGQHSDRTHWLTYLDRALREDRLQLYRQTITSLTAQSVGDHYEILLYMQGSPEDAATVGALVPPGERQQLGPVLNRWMLRDVMRWLIRDPRRLRQLFVCSLNLSRHSLQDEGFPRFLRERLGRYDIPADKLCFTFSETAITGGQDLAVGLLRAIKALGCRIAVDSFASTLSGFSYLKQIPVDFLRIDGYLIKDMSNNPVAYSMVKSINEVAHALGIATIAKRVDEPENMDALRTLEVDYAQGPCVAMPVRLEN